MKHRWLEWAQELQSIAQAGLEYSRNAFDLERFERIRQISVEIVSSHTDLSAEKVVGLFANERGYQTPKVDVRGVVFKDGRLLLVKENDGRWALPGGWAETNLTLSENVKKEVLEESGFSVQPDKVIAVIDRNTHTHDGYPYSVYKLFVSCTLLGGSFEGNIETSEARFFLETELPELSEMRNSTSQIEMCFKHSRGDIPEVLFD